MTNFERICDEKELPEGGRRCVVVDDVPALALRIGGEYFVIEDVCTHDGQPLADGRIDGEAIECARHGAQFSVRTGAALCMPATKGVRTFAVQVRDGTIYAASVPAGGATSAKATAPLPVAALPIAAAAPSSAATSSAAVSESSGAEPPDESAMIEALRSVIDPELMVNVVDLGLVYSVQRDDAQVAVEMTLTSPACPAGPQIVSQAKMALERLPGVAAASIKLVMSPPWTPDRMTDEARDMLGIF